MNAINKLQPLQKGSKHGSFRQFAFPNLLELCNIGIEEILQQIKHEDIEESPLRSRRAVKERLEKLGSSLLPERDTSDTRYGC
jgi:hypothetical protein